MSNPSSGSNPRAVIAGYGLAGRYFHAPLLKSIGFDVVGILTTNPDRISHAQQDFPDAKVVSEYEQLLDLGPDLSVVATGNTAHAPQAIAAMRRSIPVVVDKPMGLNLAQTKEILGVSKETGTPVCVYFNRRWDSDSLTIKKALAEGVLGNVFRLDSRFERFRPDANAQSWREKLPPSEGGGNLLDLQPHLISTALDWFGPAELVYASVRSIRGLSDDDVSLVLKHASGVDSYLSASAIAGSPGPRIRLHGDKGALVIRDLDPQENLLRAGKSPIAGKWQEETRSAAELHLGETVVPYESVAGDYNQFYALVRAALQGNGPWPVSNEDALAVASLIDQAREMSIR